MRCSDWPERLRAYLVEAQGRPFDWGRFDCAVFADGTIEAVTGERRFADCTTGYRTRIGSLRRIRKLGYPDLGSVVADRLLERRRLEARRGDILLMASSEGPALGVVTARAIIGLAETGLTPLPLTTPGRVFGVD